MYKIILITLATLWFVSCGGDKIETIQKEENSIEKKLDETEPEKQAHELKEDDRILIKYMNEKYEIEFEVYYKLYKNCNHPNGYVFIDEITRSGAGLFVKYLIYGVTNATVYVNTIHDHGNFVAEQAIVPGERVDLSNETFRAVFRTAEAIIAASLKNGRDSVNDREVKEMALKMEGRVVGVPIKN